MRLVQDGLQEFFFYILIAAFVQNMVLTKGLGISRTIKLLSDDNLENIIFGGVLCIILIVTQPIIYGFYALFPSIKLNPMFRPIIVSVCVSIVFCIFLGIIYLVASESFYQSALSVLPLAVFNSAVFGPLFISLIDEYTFLQGMAFALGSGIGYIIVLFFMELGQKKLNSLNIPKTLRGLPINLIYMGILSIVFYSLSNHSVSS